MKLTLRIALVACILSLWAINAWAAPRTFVVMPFQVTAPQGYAYLEKAIPSTLTARLTWQDQVMPAKGNAPAKAPTSPAEAQKAQVAAGADYGIWGSINIVGNDATLTVNARDKAGKVWSRNSQTTVGGLIGAVQTVADTMSRELFGRKVTAPVSSGQSGRPVVNQLNPALMVNETGQQEVYLNPQFRYQGGSSDDGSRLRSKSLPFAMVDFAVGNFSGKGKNEVAILGDHKLYIYEWNNGLLKPLVEHTIAMANQGLILRAIDLNKNGTKEIVAVMFDTSDSRPYSYVYTFAGGNLREYARRCEYFLNVVNLPPNYMPTLVGQSGDPLKLFQPGVYEMNFDGNRFVKGAKVQLPSATDVFSFAWLPGGKEGDKLITVNPQERLKIFSAKGAQMHQTMERYSGSSTGMEHYKSVGGLGKNTRSEMPDKYFPPMRLVAADLEKRGEYVLLVNKPISVAAEFFQRYRFYPQGEIHALYWDGVGMGLKWKTRRIKGSVVNLELADINNDGSLALVVGLNTHPGIAGVGSRQSMIVAYPLDTSLVDPKTAVDRTEMEPHN